MIKRSPVWVVTDIDGTLMDHSYDLSPAIETIDWLKKIGVPVIPCTSKTSAEVNVIRNQLKLNDPYIVENGGAIYGEDENRQAWEIVLGESYKNLKKILGNLSEEVNYYLKPLNELSDEEATKLTGLSGDSLNLMRDRHWSMPFLNPPNYIDEKLAKLSKRHRVVIFKGNRMSHLLSINSDKGKAINKLKEFSNHSNVIIIGLGDSPNDLPLLKNSDLKVVIPNINGPNQLLIDHLQNTNYILADEPNGFGWRKEIRNLIGELMKNGNYF